MFSFLSGGMVKFFQISKVIFSIFLFPSSGMAIFFQNSKTKIFNSNFKNDFFSFQIFCGINNIFLSPRLSNLIKDYQVTLKK
jgi:hypothetical protein